MSPTVRTCPACAGSGVQGPKQDPCVRCDGEGFIDHHEGDAK